MSIAFLNKARVLKLGLCVFYPSFGEISSDQKERAKQYRFLVSKGFNPELVNRLISGRTPSK
ncbi:MAG: hypothetical protein EBY06_07660 [Burkholderiaceae bacterium]|nr:hypothetical protein [Burkholderiaceae bacterium]